MTLLVSRPAALTSLALAMAAPWAAAEPVAATVVVTATRTPLPTSDIISDTLSIGPEQIAQSGAGTTATVYIRGANGNQTIVLVDGVRIGSSTTGTANWSAIPLTAIDHIEIVYGPLSTLYGADAIGGVVQIFTKQGKGAPAFSGFAGYGSDNTREADAALSGATGGEHRFSYAVSLGKEKSDGFSATRAGLSSYNPDKDGYDKQNAAAQFGLELAQGQEIGLLLLHSKLEAQYDNGTKIAYDTHNVQKLESAAVYSKNQILPSWSSLLQISESRDELGSYTSAAADGASELDTHQTDVTWQNDLRIGADLLQLLYDHREEKVISSTTRILNRERGTNSFAAAYNAKRGAHLFNASVRRDNSVYGSQHTGAAGYGYSFTQALRATASVGTSFRAPTFNELYYPGFGVPTNRPERGRNAELGLHYDDGMTQLGANYYHNRLTDLLVNTSPCPYDTRPPYNFGCAYNVNHALLEGLTLSGSRKLGNFNLMASADWQDPKDETSNKRLARRAQKRGNVALDYGNGPLTGGVELELSGDRYDDAANKNRLGGYGLVNLYATYRFAPAWSALVRWNNVADKQYDLARFYNTPGSKVFAGIRYGYK